MLETQRTGLRFALLALLVLSPLPFGSVQPWAVLALEVYAVALGTIALLIIWQDPEAISRKTRRLLVPAVAVSIIGLAQLVPVPAFWTRLVAGPTAAARQQVSEVLPELAAGLVPQSLQPPATLDALLRWLAYVLIGLAAAVSIRTLAHLGHAAVVIALSGSFQALYGSAEYLSGHQHIFAYAKRAFSDEASGTFINRNHFAGYLAMALPFALGLVLGRPWRRTAESWRSRVLALFEPAGLAALAGGFSAALIWAGAILSYSRAGLAVALVGTGFVTLSVPAGRRRLGIMVVVLLLPISWLLWQEVQAPGERFFSDRAQIASLSNRMPVWRTTASMIPKYAAVGAGFGTFENAFDLHRPPEIKRRWDHAHNDWLQLALEGGLLCTVGVLLVLLGALAIRPDVSGATIGRSVLPVSLIAAILAIAVHSTVDFCLRIPANAVLLAVILGLSANFACLSRPGLRNERNWFA